MIGLLPHSVSLPHIVVYTSISRAYNVSAGFPLLQVGFGSIKQKVDVKVV